MVVGGPARAEWGARAKSRGAEGEHEAAADVSGEDSWAPLSQVALHPEFAERGTSHDSFFCDLKFGGSHALSMAERVRVRKAYGHRRDRAQACFSYFITRLQAGLDALDRDVELVADSLRQGALVRKGCVASILSFGVCLLSPGPRQPHTSLWEQVQCRRLGPDASPKTQRRLWSPPGLCAARVLDGLRLKELCRRTDCCSVVAA